MKFPCACLFSLLLIDIQTTWATPGSQFASHVSVNTPARSFTHGVGDPIPLMQRRPVQPQRAPKRIPFRQNRPLISQMRDSGYPRIRPSIPFDNEEKIRDNSVTVFPWQYNSYREVAIPVLPASPYKVDSPDPESLWPEGLFLPPINPPRFGSTSTFGRRTDSNDITSDTDPLDQYLLEGSEAIAAVERSRLHGVYYFHDIPHIESLLANQETRVKNQLKPHRIGSIRHTWPYNRP